MNACRFDYDASGIPHVCFASISRKLDYSKTRKALEPEQNVYDATGFRHASYVLFAATL